MKIKDLKKGQTVEITLMVKEATLRETKKKSLYCVLELTDGVSRIKGMIWDYPKGQDTPPIGLVADIRGTVGEFNNDLQLTITTIVQNNQVPTEDFLKHGPQCAQDAYELLMRYLQAPGVDSVATKLAMDMIENVKESFCTATAGKSIHHDYRGGLVQHTCEVVILTASICDIMKNCAEVPVCRDLAVAGAAIHDIGKIQTYQEEALGVFDMSTEGRLLDHIVLGVQYLTSAGQKSIISQGTLDVLTHIITSHHGQLEWGSPVPPRCIEAQIVHIADLCSARCTTMANSIAESNGQKLWSNKGILGQILNTGLLDQ